MNKSALAIATGVIVVVAIIFTIYTGTTSDANKDVTVSPPSETQKPTSQDITESDKLTQPASAMEDKLIIEEVRAGDGALATSGKIITVNYKGTLVDGKQFDSSYDRGEPFTFTLGAGEVIEGWDKGFDGMRVNGKRKLTIPASMGYGAQGAGALIPPNATLVFEVELLKVE